MAAAAVPIPCLPRSPVFKRPPPLLSFSSAFSPRRLPFLPRSRRRRSAPAPPAAIRAAYITALASDPNLEEGQFRGADDAGELEKDSLCAAAISWGLLWSLLARHKLRLLVSAVSLLGCTTCTLSMPIFSGQVFFY